MKKSFATIMIAMMMMCFMPSAAFGATAQEWQVSKSKEATNLDGNYESKVTLSLPSAEEQLATDIVFVLDKSTSADLEDDALDMLTEIRNQAESTGAKVKVGVVIFNKVANVTEFKDLATEYGAIEEAIKQTIESGTNTHAGLLAGKAMLDNDTAVDVSRKYLIFVSDGITYMYNENPTVTAWSFNNPNSKDDWYGSGSWASWAGPDNWYSKYHTNNPPEKWDDWIVDIASKVANQGTQFEYPYNGTKTKATAEDIKNWDKDYAMSIDKALYLTYTTYQEVAGKYNCYAMTANPTKGSDYKWGPSFMNFLAGDKEANFSDIQNDILYLLGSGSSVEDVIGKGTDNHGNTYDFKFVPEANKISLTVGDKTYATVKADPVGNETARFLFTFEGVRAENQAQAPFELRYYENGTTNNAEEHFVWDINVAVKNFERVQLTYPVVLTNPQKTAGTYGQYDRDGSQNYNGLYTNNSAVLYPVDSNKSQGAPEDFPKPTVSYTVSSPYIPPVTNYYTVTYNDGVDGEEVFADQVNRGLTYGTLTPEFKGVPVREGYIFKGWMPAVAERVTSNAYYQATWEKKAGPTDPTEPAKPEKPTKPEKPDTPTKPCRPDTEVPKTGDNSADNMFMGIFLLTLSTLGGTLLWYRKKQRG